MTEPNKPLDQMTAQERLDLGRSYFKEGRFDEAITVWSTITRDDSPKVYALTQLGIGAAYQTLGKLKKAIKAWSKVRSDENSEAYAKAQLGIGVAYQTLGKLKKAIKAWSKVRSDENSEAYAKAQLGIGVAYQTLGKLKKAIKAWSKVRHGDDPKAYAGAQFNLGITYKNQDRLGEAITALSSINHEDDRKTYAKAQRNLGVVYHTLGKLDEAIDAWSKVRNDDPEAYAWAQFNLGVAYYAQEDWEQAIAAWSNIHREKADPETYTQAQLGLGAAYYAQEDWEQAIAAWSNIHREKADPETYAQAQFGLGEIHKDKGNIKQAKDAYRNVQGPLYYRAQREYRILGCPPELINDLRSLAKNTDKVRESLQIIPKFESKVAHYTRPQIAFDLFEGKKNDKEPSNFRLSTIRGVNDPTEGLVLNGYWNQQGIPETIHTNNTATFISCFTFNHDSLNQFRLYGKENGQEATGVSLVFKKEFFSDQPDTLGFIAGPSIDPSNKSGENESNEAGKPESDNKKPLIGKSTLYRCIYLDPETGYLTLAQRDKSNFYRQHKEKAKNKWKKYHKSLSKKEKSVNKHLFAKNKSVLSTLQSIFKKYQGYSTKEKQHILETIRFILLPLQYLVKHIAFQEEQECRIMYITQFRDEKIHSNREEQKMYVEYEESVLPHIDKIWLSPGAAKDQDFFRIRLDQGSGKSKVRISQNPFRNKE